MGEGTSSSLGPVRTARDLLVDSDSRTSGRSRSLFLRLVFPGRVSTTSVGVVLADSPSKDIRIVPALGIVISPLIDVV